MLTTHTALAEIDISAPAGFEDEIDAIETIVDLVYKGSPIGSAAAIFDEDTITFSDPDGLVSLIPGLRDHTFIAAELGKQLQTHSDRACENDGVSKSCGWLDTDTVGVIFNQSLFQAEFFINDLYTYHRDERSRYLPPPTIAPGFINSIDVRGFHDLDDERFSGSARISSIAGRGRWSLRAENVLTDRNQMLQSLSVAHVGRKHEFEAGYLPYSYQSGLLNSTRTLGIRFGSSLKSRLDKNTLYSSGLAVNVDAPAVVEIVRDGVVLDVQQVEPGRERLDTQRLPGGSYDVTLRVQEGGSVREEIQSFSTGRGLPPVSHTVWNVEIGAPVESGDQTEYTPQVLNAVYANARIERRIAPYAALSGRLEYVDNQAFAETALNLEKGAISGHAGAVVSNQGDWGVDTRLGFQKEAFSASLNYREVRREAAEGLNELSFNPLQNSFRQASLNTRWKSSRARLGLRAYYRESDTGENWFITPSLDYTLVKGDVFELTGTLRQDFGATRDTSFVGLRLSARASTGKNGWRNSISGNSSYRHSTGGASPSTTDTISDLTWRSTRKFSDDDNVEISASLRHEKSLGGKAGVRLQNSAGHANVDVWRNYQLRNALFLDAATTIVAAPSGVAVSSTHKKAGVFVSVASERKLDVNAVVNGSTKTTFSARRQSYVPLGDFAIHDVGVKPARASDLRYEQRTDRLVLFPGNIPVLKRKFSHVRIVVGRLTDMSGQALPNETIYGRDGRWLATSDTDGYFQADLEDDETLTIGRQGLSRHCRSAPLAHRVDGVEVNFQDLGIVRCGGQTSRRIFNSNAMSG